MSHSTREPGTVPLLKAILADTPSLPEAACAGRQEMFDPQRGVEAPDVLANRHRRAQALCRSCPALTPCRAWVDDQPPHRRPAGVIAGRLPPPPARPGRPPRAAS